MRMVFHRVNQPSSNLKRFGRDLEPKWVYGPLYQDVITASWTPPTWSFTQLIAYPVGSDTNTYIYGYYISTEEPNRFWVVWWRHGLLYYNTVEMPMGGTVMYADKVPINVAVPANKYANDPPENAYVYIFATETNNHITKYQGGILVADEPLTEEWERGVNI